MKGPPQDKDQPQQVWFQFGGSPTNWAWGAIVPLILGDLDRALLII